MNVVMARDLPDGTLLQPYADDPGTYTDCFTKDVKGDVDLATFVSAFYTTRLFKMERLILRLTLGKAATDGQAKDMAQGHTEAYSAWTVEGRTFDELLMCDWGGNTRSWFMVTSEGDRTRLHFGSAVVGKDHVLVRLLMPFHQWYARALLRAVKV